MASDVAGKERGEGEPTVNDRKPEQGMRAKTFGIAVCATERVFLDTEFTESAEEERAWMDLAGDWRTGEKCGAEEEPVVSLQFSVLSFVPQPTIEPNKVCHDRLQPA